MTVIQTPTSSPDQVTSPPSAAHPDTDASLATPAAEGSFPDPVAAGRSGSSTKRKAVPPPSPTERVGQAYRLSQPLDWGIRYAALMLEQQDGTRRSQQDLVDQAVTELLLRLKKKGMDFPASILP